jgi:hypothetical protein
MARRPTFWISSFHFLVDMRLLAALAPPAATTLASAAPAGWGCSGGAPVAASLDDDALGPPLTAADVVVELELDPRLACSEAVASRPADSAGEEDEIGSDADGGRGIESAAAAAEGSASDASGPVPAEEEGELESGGKTTSASDSAVMKESGCCCPAAPAAGTGRGDAGSDVAVIVAADVADSAGTVGEDGAE